MESKKDEDAKQRTTPKTDETVDDADGEGDEKLPQAKQRTPEEDEELFVRGLLERGEAARPDESGELPPGATHEIVDDAEEEDDTKPPKVKRRRFSAF